MLQRVRFHKSKQGKQGKQETLVPPLHFSEHYKNERKERKGKEGVWGGEETSSFTAHKRRYMQDRCIHTKAYMHRAHQRTHSYILLERSDPEQETNLGRPGMATNRCEQAAKQSIAEIDR
jgi:hypothetical protein